MKCIVHGCTNKKSEGNFIGDICSPCYKYITTGRIGPTSSFLGKMQKRIDHLEQIIKGLLHTMR